MKQPKVVAIVQARMGSSRLPNKMLLYLHGYPVCEWVYRRVSRAKKIDELIFAIPDNSQNDILGNYLEKVGVNVFRGSEFDLVDRYYQAAKLTNADHIVRICADNPLICSSEIDRLIEFFKHENCDYAYNHIPRKNNYPDGLGAEISSIKLLKELHQKELSMDDREHVYNFILKNHTKYSIRTFDPPKNIAYPKLKLDLDTMSDYCRLLEKDYKIEMTAEEIIYTAIG